MDKRKLHLFSIELKKLINENKLSEVEKKITQSDLSKAETDFLFMCLSSSRYNPETDSFSLFESDNSAFLKLLNVVQSNLSSDKK